MGSRAKTKIELGEEGEKERDPCSTRPARRFFFSPHTSLGSLFTGYVHFSWCACIWAFWVSQEGAKRRLNFSGSVQNVINKLWLQNKVTF